MSYNDDDLLDEKRKKAKARKKQLEEEEEEEKRRRKKSASIITEEDDENLKEDDEDDENDQYKEDEEQEEEDEEQEEEEQEQGQEEQRRKEKDNKKDEKQKGQDKNDRDDRGNLDKEHSESKDPSNTNNIDKNTENGIESTLKGGNSETSGVTSPSGTGGTSSPTLSASPTPALEVAEGATSTGGAAAGGASAGGAAAGGAATGGAAAGGAAAGGAAAGGAAAGGAAAGGAAAVATAAWPVLVVVLIIILIIFIIITVIGMIFFFITMPGMVVDKIGNAITNFREQLEAFKDGDKAAHIYVNREQVISAAEYLEQMGYDLKGYGFLSDTVEEKLTGIEKEGIWSWIKDTWSSAEPEKSTNLPLESFSTKTIEERIEEDSSKTYQEVYVSSYSSDDKEDTIRENVLMTKDSDGNLTFVKSDKLAMYLASENAIYLIRNLNTDWGNRALKSFGINDTSEGSGLIYFVNTGDKKVTDYVKNGDDLKFENAEGILGSDRVQIEESTKTLKIKNSDDGLFKTSWFEYNLDGWASLYGVPLKLSLALHLSSLAPKFSYDVANRGASETAVEMGLIEQTDVDIQTNVLLTINGVEDFYTYVSGSGLTSSTGNKYNFSSASDIPREVVEALINARAISDVIVEESEAKENQTEYEEKLNHAREQSQARVKEATAAFNFLDSTKNIKTEHDFTRRIPIILEVKNHWYQDLSFKDCYEWNDSEGVTERYEVPGYSGIVYLEVEAPGTITQINDATLKGEAGEWIRNLIDNVEYFKYDGIKKSEETSKINFKESAVDAIAMLEQIEGEDAQNIIRMFKELMSSYNIYFEDTEGTEEKKELFSKIIRDYTGKLLTDGEECVYKANIPPMQKGFEVDRIVQAPCRGVITYRTDNAICIEIDAPDKTYDDYTILISGFKVKDDIFSDTIVEEGAELGLTIVQDLKLVLRDQNGAIVKNNTVIVTDEDFDGDGNYDTIDEQTAMMYGYTQEQLNTLYAVVAQEGGTQNAGEINAVTTCMMLRAIRNNLHTSDGEHYNAYTAAIASNQFEAYGAGHYKKYMPGGSNYRLY